MFAQFIKRSHSISQCVRFSQSAVNPKPKGLKRILIANRGEIACRVINSAKRMGIETVAVYSSVDKNARHVQMADTAFLLGPAPSANSYLNKEKIIEVALNSGAEGIHPGYGFLSENVEFAEMCQKNNVIFIGPPATAIRDMGIKSTSKAIMLAADVPVVPGYHGDNQDDSFLLEQAKNIGFPVMIKAVRGGGGKGMRISQSESDFMEQLESARRESQKSFSDSVVLIEKYVGNPRHVEVQIFGDTFGNYVYLFERDCSVQRRHQKIIEEAPGPGISDEIRKQLGEAAVRAAKAVQYVGAGTVEFIFDPATQKFYFMEMNTRLQVEHPITEMISNTDLVEWQLRVAGGETLPLSQEQLKLNGHAFEARIYAEDTENNFMPGAGPLHYIHTPSPNSDVRVETGVRSGDEVSVHYDPMIAKLVVWDKDRHSALRKLKYNLSQYNIVGVKTNVDFLMRLCSNEDFIEGNVYTGFIDDHKSDLFPSQRAPDKKLVSTVAAGFIINQINGGNNKLNNDRHSPFNLMDSFRLHSSSLPQQLLTFKVENETYKVKAVPNGVDNLSIDVNDEIFPNVSVLKSDQNSNEVIIDNNGEQMKYRLIVNDNLLSVFTLSGSYQFELEIPAFATGAIGDDSSDAASKVVAPIPGVVEKVNVTEGQSVKSGEPLIILMAMKMEYVIKASRDCVIDKVLFKVGDNVPKGAKLVEFKKE
ncbi:hypothetical protein B4U80_00946 [Leptotrombidium deliense]|uniref:Methylcrotonoyl-CoA carboxylase subunit alpha-like protein n=1 Tax=Leptotrombidium deliense TaxID=299467 RepID=A0A443SK12_9ACAR|nr:hypothetical protein B4U80_00946 [Leptotrombidium deliense]